MVCTIGSLVKETSARSSWLLSGGLYAAACLFTSALLGTALGVVGLVLEHGLTGVLSGDRLGLVSGYGMGAVAAAYGMSDLGWLRLPRPVVMSAVPVDWWRQWRPYGAALAYGSALGLGVLTRVPFGAFYVLCAWCVSQGNPLYAASVMGTYGFARGIAVFPTSWYVYRRRSGPRACLLAPPWILSELHARALMTALLFTFAAVLVVAAAGHGLT